MTGPENENKKVQASEEWGFPFIETKQHASYDWNMETENKVDIGICLLWLHLYW